MNSVFKISVLLSALCVTAVIADDRVGNIRGSVINAVTREPLPGARVILAGTGLGAATNIDGDYLIDNIPVGTYVVQASLIGYDYDVKNDVVIDPTKVIELDFALRENPLDYGKIVVTPDYFTKSPDFELSTQVQSNEEIRRLPGGFEDVVRAVSILPGVAQAQNGRNDLIIRGGAPSENLYVVENLESNNINHFGTQGASGGPLSFINLDYVEETSFTTGGFGVRYGDKLSSVLNIDLRKGRTDRLGGKATISASQFGLDFESPLSDNASFLLSARRSYLDLIFKASGFSFVPEYWDFISKVDYRIGKSDNISFLVTGALDRVKYFNDTPDDLFDNSRVLGSDQDQAISGITWQHLIQNGFTNLTIGYNFADFFYQQNDSLLNPIFRNKSTENEIYVKGEIIYQFSREFEVTAGLKTQHLNFRNDVLISGFLTDYGDSLAIDRLFEASATKASSFMQFSYYKKWFKLSAGLRGDYFDLIKDKYATSPRFQGSISLSEVTDINLSYGQYFQSPSNIWLIANPINRELSFIKANQYIAGIEQLLRRDVKASLETYYKTYHDYPSSLDRPYLIMANTGAGFGGGDEGFASFGLDRLASDGKGRSWGIEFLVQKKYSEIPCYGIISIGYGHSKFTAIDGITRPSNWDQRWIINLGGGYIFDSKWEIGTKFRLATGRPYTPFNNDGTKDISAYNTERIDVNHSLDLRLDRRWMFDKWMMVTYVDIQNIYNRRQKDIPRWNERDGSVDDEAGIGILPTIGISVSF
ncbi:MAG: TonB-dependent receptor [Candidatus Zixiibacteriota bacterium]|nr:MAG: TonB-dependent receptor [candidate division Zixibacteria bacterium]